MVDRKAAKPGATTPDIAATRRANRKYYLEHQARGAFPKVLGAVLSEAVSLRRAEIGNPTPSTEIRSDGNTTPTKA
jgi:hypothetical protein